MILIIYLCYFKFLSFIYDTLNSYHLFKYRPLKVIFDFYFFKHLKVLKFIL